MKQAFALHTRQLKMPQHSKVANDVEMGQVQGDDDYLPERASLMAKKTTSFDSPLHMSSYVIRSSGALEELPVKDALDMLSEKSPMDPLWIDVDIQGDDLVKELPILTQTILDKLHLSPFLRRHLAEPTQLQTPQVLPLSQSALIVMRVLGTHDKDTRNAAALCLPSVLLTITSSSDRKKHGKGEKMDSLFIQEDTLRSMCERELAEASISGAAALWCNFHLDRSARATIRLRKTVYALIDESEYIENIKMKQIDECKDSLLRFASVAEEQLECVQNLEGGDAMSEGLDFTTPVLKGALAVILSTASSTERAIGRLEKRVADLQTKYDAHQQDKISHRLNVLTIISAIFLPLSLLTGFWGMNWEEGMPAIHTEYGFYYALAAMVVLGFALLYGFYRAGWMDR